MYCVSLYHECASTSNRITTVENKCAVNCVDQIDIDIGRFLNPVGFNLNTHGSHFTKPFYGSI